MAKYQQGFPVNENGEIKNIGNSNSRPLVDFSSIQQV
jgi:hypothetical protein